MRKRPIAHRLFLLVTLLLLTGAGITLLVGLAGDGYFGPNWQKRAAETLESLAPYFVLTGEQAQFITWMGGILTAVGGAALTLLATWHFAEINLPSRLKDLADANSREHLAFRPELIAAARVGVGMIPADIELSRLTFLRKLIGWWSTNEEARVLAASTSQIAKEAAALAASAKEAQQRQITAHIIRALQYEASKEPELAIKEMTKATEVRSDDLDCFDIAAGMGRRLKKRELESKWLGLLQEGAGALDARILQAQALRRQSELEARYAFGDGLKIARDKLLRAAGLLQPLATDETVKLELGRILTLFCEVQCARGVVKQITTQNGAVAQSAKLLEGVQDHARPNEDGGEMYGENRARRVKDLAERALGEAEED